MTELSLRLLRLIGDGEFQSGEVLARALGVSRATVWNAVRAVEGAGLEVYKVRGRGYKLSQPLSLLDAREIKHSAGPSAARLHIETVDVVDSTNTVLMERARGGARSGTVIAAEIQHGGRGRMGRVWHAGIGSSLTFSVLWRFRAGAAGLAGLSLAAGIAVVRALDALGVREARLKWPNDVLWRGNKLAGMLVEMHGDALGPSAVVIGIGLNVRLSAALRGRIDQRSTGLENACGRVRDRNVVLGLLLAHLVEVLDGFADRGFSPLRPEWERYHAYQGRQVAVKLPDGTVETGTARGVADDGALLFEAGGTVRPLHSGEISVRGIDASRASSRNRARSGA